MKAILYKTLGWFLRGFVRFIGRIIYRLQVTGELNIPSKGGGLLVANHASYMDFVLVLCSVPRPVRFVMNADIFKKPGLKWILQGLNCIPISPRGGKNNFEDFNAAVTEQIQAGHLVVIFAEGTVTRTGQLLEFKKGVEHISGLITAPIIPMHFQNVHGAPFTYRAGKRKMEKASFKNFRKEILVCIGEPIEGKITAYSLRQKIKELEVANFDLNLSKTKTIDLLLKDSIHHATKGGWINSKENLEFKHLEKRLHQLDHVMLPMLSADKTVALILPKTIQGLLIQLWLIMHKKVVVNINADFNNEEQLYVLNKANIRTLITTRDLSVIHIASVSERTVYVEDIYAAVVSGEKVNIVFKKINQIGRSVKSMFQSTTRLNEIVTVVFERQKGDELKCVALTHRNLLSVLLGLRQIYYFEKGSRIMSNLPLCESYGMVLELLLPVLNDLQLVLVHEEISATEFIEKLLETKPSIVIATPRQLEFIAELSQVKNIPFLTHIFTAALKPDNESIRLLGERGIQVMVCAGMNETSSVFAINLHNYKGIDIAGKTLEQENMDSSSIGKALPGTAVKVCDDLLVELENDVAGTLWVKGGSVAPSIDEGFSCQLKLSDGWLNTGIKGSINHKGFISISNK